MCVNEHRGKSFAAQQWPDLPGWSCPIFLSALDHLRKEQSSNKVFRRL